MPSNKKASELLYEHHIGDLTVRTVYIGSRRNFETSLRDMSIGSLKDNCLHVSLTRMGAQKAHATFCERAEERWERQFLESPRTSLKREGYI